MDYKIKQGRPRAIKSIEQLLEFWNGYVDHIKSESSKWRTMDFRGKDAKEVTILHTVPMTKFGFAHFCGLHAWEVLKDLKDVSKDFSELVTRIEQLIYNQKLEGASVGAFNSSIIASDLGLKNRNENTNKTELNISVSGSLESKLDDLIEG